MTMPATLQVRQRLITKALNSVTAASKAITNSQFTNADSNQHFLEASVRSAMGYGYPVETVANAASMTVAEITAITNRTVAA